MDLHGGVCLLRTNVYDVCLLLVWIFCIPKTCVVVLSWLLTWNSAWHHCFKVSGVVVQTWNCRCRRYEQQFCLNRCQCLCKRHPNGKFLVPNCRRWVWLIALFRLVLVPHGCVLFWFIAHQSACFVSGVGTCCNSCSKQLVLAESVCLIDGTNLSFFTKLQDCNQHW